MSLQPFAGALPAFELSISRLIDAPRRRVFRAWTDPELLKLWWGPHGMTTPECTMQLWPGGVFSTLMRAQDGSEYPSQGVFLEIEAPRRIVFTDAFLPGWVPAAKPFMTGVVTLDDVHGKTRYSASAWHWNEQDQASHEAMGFHQGWNESLDRLVDLVTGPLLDQ